MRWEREREKYIFFVWTLNNEAYTNPTSMYVCIVECSVNCFHHSAAAVISEQPANMQHLALSARFGGANHYIVIVSARLIEWNHYERHNLEAAKECVYVWRAGTECAIVQHTHGTNWHARRGECARINIVECVHRSIELGFAFVREVPRRRLRRVGWQVLQCQCGSVGLWQNAQRHTQKSTTVTKIARDQWKTNTHTYIYAKILLFQCNACVAAAIVA